MSNKIKNVVFAGFVAMVMALGVGVSLAPAPAYAAGKKQTPPPAIDPSAGIQSGVNASGGQGQKPLNVRLQSIVNVLLFVLGAIAVIMIVIGGIRYATSGGDSNQITGAKNTILYSVIGLVVAILAYAIVNFVVNAFKG